MADNWSEDLDGDEFGVRYTYPNGRREVVPAGHGFDADKLIRSRPAIGGEATMVSRPGPGWTAENWPEALREHMASRQGA